MLVRLVQAFDFWILRATEVRDPTHATRRIFKRPLAADTALQTVWDFFVTGRCAIIRALSNSEPFKTELFDQIEKMEGAGRKNKMVNFSIAMHRFESSYEPVQKLIFHIVPVVAASQKMCSTRSNNKKDPVLSSAKKFLEGLTDERFLPAC